MPENRVGKEKDDNGRKKEIIIEKRK